MHYKKQEKKSINIDSAKDVTLPKNDVKLLEDFYEYLKYKKEFLRYIKEKKETKKELIPISVFNTKALAPLETIVKYIREELGYTYNKIGSLLNRNAGPIGVTYRKAAKKFQSKLDISSTENSIPILIFKDSKITIFECIVVYLKDDLGLKFRNMSELVNRNYRTVWTVYKRAKKKLKNVK